MNVIYVTDDPSVIDSSKYLIYKCMHGNNGDPVLY